MMFPLQMLISHTPLQDKRLFFPGKVRMIYSSTYLKTFVSYLVWDLLHIDVNGFKAFCKYFLEKYPEYFISPLRISGSAMESLFSQYE